MPYADLGSYRLYYEDYLPQQETTTLPILFLHGFTLDHRMWCDDAAYFRQWYRVLLLDSKGHGSSDAPETDYSRDHRVDDVIKFLDYMGIDKVHIVGLSMGGTTGIGLALKCPERLASLTLVSTSAAGYDIGPKISRIDKIAREQGIEAARKRWMDSSLLYYKEDRKQIRDLLEKMMLEHSGAIWNDPKRGLYPRSNDLEHVATIKTKTLILIGTSDKIFLPLARELHQRIAGSRLSEFESVGHMLNLESPVRFRAELKVFLEGASKL